MSRIDLFHPARLREAAVTWQAPARVGAWCLSAFVMLVVLVLFIVRVPVVVTAHAQLITIAHTRDIQAPFGSRVLAIAVTAQQSVRRGDVLVTLDTTQLQAELERAASVLASLDERHARLLAWRSRLNALRTGGSAHALSVAGANADVLEADWRLATSRLDLLKRDRHVLEVQKEAAAEQGRTLRQSLANAEHRVASLEHLHKSGYVSTIEVEREQEVLRKLRSDNLDFEARQQEIAARQHSNSAERNRTIDDMLAKGMNELNDNEFSRKQQKSTLDRLNTEIGLAKVTAPIDGIVQDIDVTGPGQVVATGATLARVAPQGEALEFDALISNRDIGFVRAGQAAAIRLTTFPYERYGTLPGKVQDIAADATKLGDAWKYHARVHPDRYFMSVEGRVIPLLPGESGEVDIVLRHRRLVDFIIEPVFGRVSETVQMN